MKKRSMIAAALCLTAALMLHGCGEKPPADVTADASASTAATDVSAAESSVSATEQTPVTASAAEPDASTAPTESAESGTSGTSAETDGTDGTHATVPTETAAPATVPAETTATAAPVTAAETTAQTAETAVTSATSATTERKMTELIDIANSRQSGADYFVSPYRQISHIGDPYVLYDEASGKYYMYCTGGKFKCWSSDTLKSWTELGDAYTVTDKSFGTQNYWAPEVYKWNGAYYMVYSAARPAEGSLSSTGMRHSIGLAKADSPAGPFTDVYDHPLYAPDYSVIDASLLFDDDGKIYLFYSKDCSENVVDGKKTSQVFGIELASDLGSTVGEPVLLATPQSAWELKSGSTVWNEGPCVFKKNGTYYLLFTANYYASASYSVGYATASTPLGTYKKAAENPILIGDGKNTSGTGHCSVTRSPDGTEMYIVYHSHADVTQTTNPVANRTPCFDRLVVRPDGRLAVSGPSIYMQPIPSGLNGLYKKYDGVKISSSYPSLNGRAENLLDGVVTAKLGDEDLYRFTVTKDGCITLEFDSAVELSALWIWGTEHATLSPKSVSAVLDDTYQLRAKNFSTVEGQTPVVLTFGNLPAGTRTKTVKLYFEAADAAGGAATVCEITVVAKQ